VRSWLSEIFSFYGFSVTVRNFLFFVLTLKKKMQSLSSYHLFGPHNRMRGLDKQKRNFPSLLRMPHPCHDMVKDNLVYLQNFSKISMFLWREVRKSHLNPTLRKIIYSVTYLWLKTFLIDVGMQSFRGIFHWQTKLAHLDLSQPMDCNAWTNAVKHLANDLSFTVFVLLCRYAIEGALKTTLLQALPLQA